MSKALKPSRQEEPGQRSPQLSAGKRRLFLAVLVLVPFVIIAFLEGTLRFFRYGSAYEQWVESADGQGVQAGGRYLMLNPGLALKYFHSTSSVPFSNEDAFDKMKKANSFRVFVLGESSAAGYPYEPNGAFSRFLQRRLSLLYPDSKIEVINCGMSAISSYTLRDLTPGVLEQKPDLILLYAGHNEYYGALGAGSTETLGGSRFIVNLVLRLEQFRLFQLLRNTLQAITGLFSEKHAAAPGTLMARMVQQQYIGYGSDLYERGMSQFKGNMRDILEMITEARVPVIMGTLTCNLKDHPPFVSLPSAVYPPAKQVYEEARQELAHRNTGRADSLFRFARDLDALKFRAPGEFNTIIRQLAATYGIQVVDIDSAFREASPDHIVGNNLMVDHLHPTLYGYQYIGKLFFEKMEQCHYLPATEPRSLTEQVQDSITLANLHMTALDSVIAGYKMAVLKNNWPFVQDGRNFSSTNFIHPKNRIDSLAAAWLQQRISWKNAHLAATEWYLANHDVHHALKEMDALIEQYPYNDGYYRFAVTTLLPVQDFVGANRYLTASYAIEPDAFNAKWLGALCLRRGETDTARYYLEKSLFFDSDDPQTWYQLALAYLNRDNIDALTLVERALAGDPHYQEALVLRDKLVHARD